MKKTGPGNRKLELALPRQEESIGKFLTQSGTFKDGNLLVNKDGLRIVSQSEEGGPHLIKPLDNTLSLDDLDAVKVVGKGSGGIVQLVRHKWTSQFFALKVIQMNIQEDIRKQIAQELRISLSTQCPFVVQCYQCFYDNGVISIVLEYMDGGSLADFLKSVRTIPEPYLAAICNQVLNGLIYLHHEKHIIHRDMKPSNILINHTGEVKISDFGVSAIISAAGVNLASAATPPGSTPQVANTLGIKFEKNLVQPGELIDQAVADAGQPTLYAPSAKLNGRNLKKHPSPQNDKTYIFTMVDLNLPFFALPNTTDFASLVPGIGPNRTTRLHWFEYNVHAVNPHQTLQNFSTPIAEYEGPQPPQGDEPHNYVIYLFEQPENYKPNLAAAAAYANETSFARMNFSIKALEAQIGAPIAANYFMVENENNTKSS